MPQENPFSFLEQLQPQEVADRLGGEMSFVQGAALCMMSPVASAKIMACMDDGRRREVAAAMSKSRQMPRDVLADIADELQKKGGFRPRPTSAPAPGTAPGVGLSGLARLKNLRPLSTPDSHELHGVQPVEATIRPPKQMQSAMIPAQKDQAEEKAGRKQQAIDEALNRARGVKTTRAPMPAPSADAKSAGVAGKARKIDGMALAAHILREAGTSVLSNIRHELPELYDRLHQRMFDFSDLERSAPQTLGAVFTGVELEAAALALRFASDSLREKVFSAISPRRAEMLRDEMAADKSRVRLTAIDDAQQKVIDFALKLQDSGRILIDPNESDLV